MVEASIRVLVKALSDAGILSQGSEVADLAEFSTPSLGRSAADFFRRVRRALHSGVSRARLAGEPSSNSQSMLVSHSSGSHSSYRSDTRFLPPTEKSSKLALHQNCLTLPRLTPAEPAEQCRNPRRTVGMRGVVRRNSSRITSILVPLNSSALDIKPPDFLRILRNSTIALEIFLILSPTHFFLSVLDGEPGKLFRAEKGRCSEFGRAEEV